MPEHSIILAVNGGCLARVHLSQSSQDDSGVKRIDVMVITEAVTVCFPKMPSQELKRFIQEIDGFLAGL